MVCAPSRVNLCYVDDDLVVTPQMPVGVVDAGVLLAVWKKTADVFHKMKPQDAYGSKGHNSDKECMEEPFALAEKIVDADEQFLHFLKMKPQMYEKNAILFK